MFFASILLHELGHSAVALRYEIPVRRITLFIFGGVAEIGAEPPSAAAEFVIAIAGPAVSLVLALLFSGIKPIVADVAPLWALAKYLAYINFAVFFFNLIPGYPLDGGRVFRAIIWAVTGNMRRATLFAANVGRLFGFFFIFVGVWRIFSGDVAGFWIAFVGWFLDGAATAQIHQVMFQGLLAGHTVSQTMSRDCVTISPDASLQEVVDQHILSGGRRCVLVSRGENTVGLITLHRIKEVPRDEWPTTSAAQVMLPLDQMKWIGPDKELRTALEQMDRDGVNQLPVMTDGRIAGMLSREDVITFLRTLQELESRG
jgi:Zn-dependent protease/CBS domain-containing protein